MNEENTNNNYHFGITGKEVSTAVFDKKLDEYYSIYTRVDSNLANYMFEWIAQYFEEITGEPFSTKDRAMEFDIIKYAADKVAVPLDMSVEMIEIFYLENREKSYGLAVGELNERAEGDIYLYQNEPPNIDGEYIIEGKNTVSRHSSLSLNERSNNPRKLILTTDENITNANGAKKLKGLDVGELITVNGGEPYFDWQATSTDDKVFKGTIKNDIHLHELLSFQASFHRTLNNNSKHDQQLSDAHELGLSSLARGKEQPAQDGELLKMFTGREVGKTPEKEASTIDLINSWIKGRERVERLYRSEPENLRTKETADYIIRRIESKFKELGEKADVNLELNPFKSNSVTVDISEYAKQGIGFNKMIDRFEGILERMYGEKQQDWFRVESADYKTLKIDFRQRYIVDDMTKKIIKSFKKGNLPETLKLIEGYKMQGRLLNNNNIKEIGDSNLTKEQKVLTLVVMGVHDPAKRLFETKAASERFEVGTPVTFKNTMNREVSGEVVFKEGVKTVSLYKDDNYSGPSPRLVEPNDWSKVEKFSENVSRNKSKGGSMGM